MNYSALLRSAVVALTRNKTRSLLTILGIVMAFKFGRSRRVACYSLAFGVAFPLVLILVGLLR